MDVFSPLDLNLVYILHIAENPLVFDGFSDIQSLFFLRLWAHKPTLKHFPILSHRFTDVNKFFTFLSHASDSFMIMSLYTTRDYVPPDFCGILSLRSFAVAYAI